MANNGKIELRSEVLLTLKQRLRQSRTVFQGYRKSFPVTFLELKADSSTQEDQVSLFLQAKNSSERMFPCPVSFCKNTSMICDCSRRLIVHTPSEVIVCFSPRNQVSIEASRTGRSPDIQETLP